MSLIFVFSAYLFSSTHNWGELLDLGVGLFASLLLIVSLLSYRRTRLTRLLLVSAAFGLFVTKTLLHHIGMLVLNWSARTENVVFSLIDLLILATFFFALIVPN
ncbi:MAG: hypothetical protein JRN52_16310 [Nitrososphaerota archaeon]|nr:hypothetical protein [Nitrososphaerota archaeon]